MPATTDQNQQKSAAPNFKIDLRRDNNEAIGYRHNVRPSAAFDPVGLTLRVLESRLKWRIVNAHYDIESPVGTFDAETAFGATRFNLSDPRCSIAIDLAAEVVWQLLTTQLSSSEKTMVSWMLAATMVHELCVSIPLFFQNAFYIWKITSVNANLITARHCGSNASMDSASYRIRDFRSDRCQVLRAT